MEELKFSYRVHSTSSYVCFTSTGENPLSSLPWSSVNEPKSAWLSWQNNPFSDHRFFGRHKNPYDPYHESNFGFSPKHTTPIDPQLSDCVNGERLHITLLILKPLVSILFCSKRTLLFCFASFELSLIVSSQTNSF